jgi:predicted enzyme related to lactoylglutathione lyase
MANQVVWVDIPVVDLDRAIRFYSAILGGAVQKQEYPGMTIGLLPGSDTMSPGACSRVTSSDRQIADRSST